MANTSGIFTIWVQQSNEHPWGVLQKMPYDNAVSGMKRRAVLKAARFCVRNWRYHYQRFINSAFAIEEQDDNYSPSVHIEGQKRGKIWGAGQLKRKVLKADPIPESKIKRKVLGTKKQAKAFVPGSTIVEYEAPKITTRKALPKKFSQADLRVIKRHYRKQRKAK